MKTDSLIKGGAGLVASVAEAQVIAPEFNINDTISALVQIIIGVATLIGLFRKK